MPSPARGEHVVLRLPDGVTSLPARVYDADEETVTLVLSRRGEALDRLLERTVAVEYTTPLGVHRLSGVPAGAGGAGELIRVRCDGRDIVQRRGFVRVEAVVPLQLVSADQVRAAARTSTLNISGGGLLVRDPLDLRLGTALDLALELAPGSAPVRAAGRVVRDVRPGEKGIRIERIATGDRERLVRCVAERQRIALRVAGSR